MSVYNYAINYVGTASFRSKGFCEDFSEEQNISDLQVGLTSSQMEHLLTRLLINSAVIVFSPVFFVFFDPSHIVPALN